MAIVKSEAIILHTAKMGETSKRLKLYSRRNGVLTLIAKGARSPKSRLGGMLETLYVVEVVFYEKESRDMQLLSQVSVLFAPKRLLKDAERTVMAMACAEMIERFETAQNPNAVIYSLLHATIRAFDRLEIDGRLILFAFQMQLLQHLGFAPEMNRCVACQTSESEEWKFHIEEAKLYCKKCAQAVHSGVFLQPAARAALQCLATVPAARWHTLQVPPAAFMDIFAFLSAFYTFHLEETRGLRALEVLKQMKALEKNTFIKRNK
ncbi:MAG: DNA repair protein RecO [Deferribacteres bacterium]|nr:DNA repair protein RecO [candidate division KSB1 bacterium]MCB9512274.1 DNA repair protein RecO [Deferribacteres bacterium]